MLVFMMIYCNTMSFRYPYANDNSVLAKKDVYGSARPVIGDGVSYAR
jgi:hypothetical protein